jgi:putative membrane protein
MAADPYLWIKALHVVSMVAWMAGLLYLPRLFVYHCQTAGGSAEAQRFAVMERRLANGIMTPAMIATVIFGGTLLALDPGWARQGWFHFKLLGVLGLLVLHLKLLEWRAALAAGKNAHTERFYRVVNEIPALLMVVIVVLVVVKPF